MVQLISVHDYWKNHSFDTVVREETPESPVDARSNQSILKEINSRYSLERLMLKLQYFGHLMRTAASLEKTPVLGKTEGRRRSGQERMRWLDGIMGSMGLTLSKLQETVKDRGAWRAAVRWVSEPHTSEQLDGGSSNTSALGLRATHK